MLAISLFWFGIVLIVSALLMMFWDSFRYKKIWALVSLILVVPLLIHMILNWSKLNVRKAFYVLVLGILSTLVSIAGGALEQLPFLSEHEVVQVLEENIAPPKDEPLPNQQQADAAALAVEENYDPLLTGSEYESLATTEITPENVNTVNPNTVSSARFEIITEQQRAQAINKWIRLITIEGEKVEGMLTNVLPDSVLVESSVDGGRLGLSYSNDEIKTIMVRLEEGEQLIDPELEQTPNAEPDTEIVDIPSNSSNSAESTDTLVNVPEEVDDVTEAIEEQIQQVTQESPVVESEMPIEQQAIETEKEIIEESVIDQPANETLNAIEEMVDDSKAVDNPINQ